ncbi:MAG TPA: fumarylacetoacetate hydrolase family protein [Solirubrobacteraceae bacterium]|nr:fumarylacetoacetate hydrolase family protein [Solirubrobacteraceae bacterium]
MRLGTLADGGATTAAVFVDGACAAIPGFADAGAVLRAGDDGLARARAAVAGELRPYDVADLRAPVLEPAAVICVGLNFRNHVVEMGREIPTAPTLFAKLPQALCGPADDVALTPLSKAVDYEGELVVVIGARARDVPERRAHEAIAGYTLMNDVSMRDLQYRSLQWFAGKNIEASTPVGPWIVTADEIDPAGSMLRVTVNDELRQQAPIADLIFDPARLVADVSRLVTLQPGDLLATGTPGGVGHGSDPPRYLADGDVVAVEVDGIGTLRNAFRASMRG